MGLVLRQEILKAQMTEERKIVFAHYLVQLVFVGHTPTSSHLDFISNILACEEKKVFCSPDIKLAQNVIRGLSKNNEHDPDHDSTEIVSDLKDQQSLPNVGKLCLDRLNSLWAHAELFLSTSICLAALDGDYSADRARLISDYAHRLGFSAYRLSVLEREVFQALHRAGAALVCEQKEDLSQNEFSIPSREDIFQDCDGEKTKESTSGCLEQKVLSRAEEANDECFNQLKVQQLWNSDLEIVTKIENIKS